MTGPQWNIESEYPGLDSNEFKKDFAWCESEVQKLKSAPIKDNEISLFLRIFEIKILLQNLTTFTHCVQNTDTLNQTAVRLDSQLYALGSEITSLEAPLVSWFQQLTEDDFSKLFAQENLKPFQFLLTEQRKLKAQRLSDAEEKMSALLSLAGTQAWSNLYRRISGTAKVQATIKNETREYSLAELDSLLSSDDENTRKSAWNGIEIIWKTHEDASAAILNGIADWRNQMNRIRSQNSKQELDHLFYPLHYNRLDRKALDAMMDVCQKALPRTQKVLTWMARKNKKDQLGPWDLNSEPPQSSSITESLTDFSTAIDLIASSVGSISSELGDFVYMMAKNQWIEGRVSSNKAPGGYCTKFARSRTPRIYMTYRGSTKDVVVLAHELGHAYHNWVLRDLHLSRTSYPMGLAETASIFFETTVRDQLYQRLQNPNEKLKIFWNELGSAASFLINIPARFELEHQFNLQKKKTGWIGPDQLRQINRDAWQKWYGDTLSHPVERYWSYKLHYALEMPFYNFPYSFGYLFSVNVYHQKANWGRDFLSKYKELLRDTGQMLPEDITKKYFGQSLCQEEFWQQGVDLSLKAIEEKMSQLS